jgi:GAF domain-containing protein/CHASE3 domain sensor protein
MRRGLIGRMVVASGLLAMIVGGAFAVVVVTNTELRGTTDLRRQMRDELVAADALEGHLIDLEIGLRGFVITRDESFLEPANEARAALPASARALVSLAADEPVQLARVRRIVRAMNAYVRHYALLLVDATRRNDPSVRSVDRTVTAKRRVDALRDGLNSFRTAERARLSARDADVDEAARRATVAAAVGVAGSILLILVFAGYLTRVIVQPLRRAALMANRLAGGDLSARMGETDVAEIGALQRSFNVMAGSLETSRDELASLLAEQAALRSVATLVARGAAPTEVFAVTATEVCRLLGTDATALCRYETDATVTVLALETDVDLGVSVGARITLEGENAMGTVLRTGRAARQDSFESTTGTLAGIARKGRVRTSVGAPIVVDGRLWGVVVVSSRDRVLPASTEQHLSDFTELVATAIANSEARTEVGRLVDEQAALRRVATLVARESPPEELFAAVVEEVGRVFPVENVALARYESGGMMTTVAISERLADSFLGRQWPLGGKNVSTMVFETGRPARLDSYGDASGRLGVAMREQAFSSAVGAPIVVEGRVWGVMTLASTEQPLPADTEARLASFSELVAAAIANAEARTEVGRLVDEQAALRRVATLVAEGATPSEVFQTVTREVGILSGADLARMERYESRDSVIGVAGWSRSDAPELAVGTRFSLEGASIAAMVHEASRPVRVDSFADAHGPIAQEAQGLGIRSSVGCPIVVDGRLWGVIAASSRSETPFAPDTESQIAEFTELVATAIANTEARTEVAASRARIVAATDEERRRVVRDLHDGAQQRLVHTVITLKLARRAVQHEGKDVPALMREALENAEQATVELRELAHGILPAVLIQGGLRAGVIALASRAPVPVEIDVSVDRLPAAVEATAYFVVAEALTNVAKHARAGHAEVTARIEHGTLAVQVRDDGVGGAWRDGSGLIGLADRLAVFDGELRVESPDGGGTLITAVIPLPG